ncbi:hypothetical protein B7D49_30280 (plasmid) [Klebsiella pneumoniae]|nr:hypothetical protein B7D49_30280 [Klebsiella pneumoniae]
MPAFEWVHVQLHQQKGMISLSPPTICNSALSLMLPNRRDRQVAARAGTLRSLSTGQAMNRLCVYRIY